MGTTLNTIGWIVLTKDAKLLPSNKVATNLDEFQEYAVSFKKGTIFKNFGRGDPEDKYSLHGWCYRTSLDSDMWKYCNFHAYILDQWRQHNDLFNVYD